MVLSRLASVTILYKLLSVIAAIILDNLLLIVYSYNFLYGT
jgi:hypothetical protein